MIIRAYPTCKSYKACPPDPPSLLPSFFCAIPPELHAKWANANAAAIKSGGILLCLVYPLKPVGDEASQAPDVGPPFLVAPEMYKALLQDRFTLEFEGVPPVLTEHNKGRQMVMVWRRK